MSVNVRPWAEVFVDGISQGTIPISKLALKAGRRKIRLENNVLGFKETTKVDISPETPVVLNRDIQRSLEYPGDGE